MSNRADAEFVFGEYCRIERNLVPISKSPSCFQTHCLRAATTIKSFQLCFRRYVKTIGQTHFDLLSEKIIGRSVAEPLTLKKFAEEKCPWRQHVGIYCIGKTAARKLGWRTVRTGHRYALGTSWPVTTTAALLLLVPEPSDLRKKHKSCGTQSAGSEPRPTPRKEEAFFHRTPAMITKL